MFGDDAGMRIFTGNANPALANKIASYLGTTLGDIEIRRFPDGEIFVKIRENIRGQDVFVIQPTCSPPNENLMELLIIIDAMRRASANRIVAVMPFYGYARQDRKDQPRVPITAKLVANLLVAAGTDRLLAMDLHAQQIQGFFDIPVDHLYSAPVMVKHVRARQYNRPVVVAPDVGGVKVAYAYSQMLECGLAIVAKQRKNATEVEALTVVGDVAGCTAIMVDDLTTTAGTLTAAARLLKQNGAAAIVGVVTHATITAEGLARLRASDISELVVTDTVPMVKEPGFPVTVLSVSELLGEAIRRISDNQSVTSLFRL
ncbi:MAG: ribose-phosphate pyrophosphokinase [Lentisphaerae bacterium RIFOXYA12_FULL_60_10]|nr:MAG: ribose-phosphate pyrophosphokinase [Lentisphaerae bacterium RIFOXYA12_FULL_60_10]